MRYDLESFLYLHNLVPRAFPFFKENAGNEVGIIAVKKNLKRRKYMNSASSVTFGSSGTPLVMT